LISYFAFSGSSVAGRPTEDVDSRTIFVSNVIILAPCSGWVRGGLKDGVLGWICLISEVLLYWLS